MSLIIGACAFTNPEITNNLITDLYEPIKHFPHEKYNFQTKRNVSFGHMLTLNTPEAVYEKQPSYDNEAEILFVSTGRIDNRENLAKKLSINLNSFVPDGELIRASFLKWGINCVDHLRGDWTFAVYDFRKNELYLARGPMGYTSIYYTIFNNTLYFATILRSLLNIPNLKNELDEEYFISLYTLWKAFDQQHSVTNFKNIQSLPMGSYLSLKNGQINIDNYWKPEEIVEQGFKKTADYKEQLLELYTKAVQVRLRSHKPVASMLSGGLDSSSVSFMAAEELYKKGEILHTFSHVPFYEKELVQDQKLAKYKNALLNETQNIQAIVESSGNIKSQLLNSENINIVQGMKSCLKIYNTPLHAAANSYWIMDLYNHVQNQGFGTLLSGEGGNGGISFEGLNHYLPITIHRLWNFPAKTLKVLIAKRIIYSYFYDAYIKFKSHENQLQVYVNNIYLNPEINERFGIINSIKKENLDFNLNYKSAKEIKRVFVDLYEQRSQLGNLSGHNFGFEMRDPTSDQDLLEFIFSIPNEAFFDENFTPRNLIKCMMHDKMPHEVLYAKKRGLQSADLYYRQMAQKEDLKIMFDEVKYHPLVLEYFDLEKLELHINFKNNNDYLESGAIYKTLLFADFLKTNF